MLFFDKFLVIVDEETSSEGTLFLTIAATVKILEQYQVIVGNKRSNKEAKKKLLSELFLFFLCGVNRTEFLFEFFDTSFGVENFLLTCIEWV